MANEGSTKPTYSEPTCMDASYRIGHADGLKKNEAELARVRGLLQRQWISVEERLPEEGESVIAWVGHITLNNISEGRWELLHEKVTDWMPEPIPPNFRESSSLVSQGAESADMHKSPVEEVLDEEPDGQQLDYGRPMKSGVEIGKVNRVECICLVDADDFDKNCPKHGYVARFHGAGIAETGGEKTAPDKACLCYCCEGNLRELNPGWNWQQFPTQRGWCQACFSEILRTEKLPMNERHDCKRKGESREPEKLNNAQNEKSDREFLERLLDTLRNSANRFQREGMSHEEVNHQILELESRLAESPLSSPPPCDHPHLDGIDQATGPDKIWECQACKELFREVKDGIYTQWVPTFRQSSSLSKSGAESAHSGKQNTADKSAASPELLPTQLPKEK